MSDPSGEAGVIAARRSGETLVATAAVAGVLIGAVFAVPGLHDLVTAAPWLAGPGLWVAATLGAAALLHLVARRRPSRTRLAGATAVGGLADALVVAAGHPWPGLAVGIAVFAIALGPAGADARSSPTRTLESQEVDR